jgi:hypothetical protein
MLDATVWSALERHGVTEGHFTMLLQLLELQKNGSWSWHFVDGRLTQADLRLVFTPSREEQMKRVRESLLHASGALAE